MHILQLCLIINKIVKQLRSKKDKENLEILIQYEDQKDNEWKSVFNHVLGFKKVTNAYGEILQTPRIDDNSGIYVNACGVGFHSQAYPSNSIDLGVTIKLIEVLLEDVNEVHILPSFTPIMGITIRF